MGWDLEQNFHNLISYWNEITKILLLPAFEDLGGTSLIYTCILFSLYFYY